MAGHSSNRHTIDRLPSELRAAIDRWLADENRSVDEFTEYLAELLAPLDIEVSRSAAHRYMKREEISAERMRQSREISETYGNQLIEAEKEGQFGRILVQQLRTIAYDMFGAIKPGEAPSPKDFALIAKGLVELSRAARFDQDFETNVRKARLEERAKAAETAKRVALEKGVSAEVADDIFEVVLGVEAGAA